MKYNRLIFFNISFLNLNYVPRALEAPTSPPIHYWKILGKKSCIKKKNWIIMKSTLLIYIFHSSSFFLLSLLYYCHHFLFIYSLFLPFIAYFFLLFFISFVIYKYAIFYYLFTSGAKVNDFHLSWIEFRRHSIKYSFTH